MNAVWFVALVATVVLAAALNSMLVLGIMVAPLIALHLWLALKETR